MGRLILKVSHMQTLEGSPLLLFYVNLSYGERHMKRLLKKEIFPVGRDLANLKGRSILKEHRKISKDPAMKESD